MEESGLANILTRLRTQPTKSAVPNPVSMAQVTRAMVVNGEMKSIAEVRSMYDGGMRMFNQSLGVLTGDYDKETVARSYKTSVTAFIGLNVRAGMSAEIPPHVVNAQDEEVYDSPAQPFIDNAPKLIWRLMAHYLIWGAIYIRKKPNKHGYCNRLEILSPLDVTPVVVRDVVIKYRVFRSYGYEEVSPDEMIVDTTYNPFSEIDGTSALEVAKIRSDIETNIGRYGAAFFANSARPDLLITTEAAMDQKKQNEAKESFRRQFQGVGNWFRAAFMGGAKWDVKPLGYNPVDLAMIDLTNQADVKILAVLRVNPVLAGIGTASDPLSAASTYEQVRRNHMDFVSIPDVRQICNVLNEQWLWKDFEDKRWTLEPDISGIVSDSLGTSDRVTTAAAAINAHAWSINEGREYTGKEPRPNIIDINPDWAWGNWDRGLMTRRQALIAQGFRAETLTTVPDGYIYELDPRAKGTPAQQPFSFSFPQQQAQSLPAPEPQKQLSAPADIMTIEPAPNRRDVNSLAQVEELRLWARKVKKSGVRAKFVAETLPADVVAFVRTSLDEQWSPASVFDAARTWIRTGQPQSLGATPEELQTYWQHYDELRTDVRDSWLDEYMMRVWSSVGDKDISLLTDHDIQAALSLHHDELVSAWVGTLENPGAILALVQAGMVAGDKSLTTGVGAKPKRAIIVNLSWDLLSQEALNFARSYCFNLIKDIDSTTVKDVRSAIAAGIEQGLSRDDIAKSLEGIFNDPNRARLIAQSESNRAYVEGSLKRWELSGVNKGKWRTVGNSACALCRRLNGQVADLSVGWIDPETGIVYRSSAHPGDRCFRVPEL